jgi:hypothetical protein
MRYQVGGNDILQGHPVAQTAVTIKQILDSLIALSCSVLFIGTFALVEPFFQAAPLNEKDVRGELQEVAWPSAHRAIAVHKAVLEMTSGAQYAKKLRTAMLNMSEYPQMRLATGVSMGTATGFVFDAVVQLFAENDYNRFATQLKPLIEPLMDSCHPQH